MVRDYRELAYMGFVTVLLHLPVILKNMRMCKQDIRQWQPDALILVDYPGFNLNIAKYIHAKGICPVYYYIAPKIWAWKEHRIKNIRRDVDELFSILPFEVDFFEKKHHYPIHYVGNPTAQEVREWRPTTNPSLRGREGGAGGGSLIALLAGSRKQEIKDNLPAMIEATKHLAGQYDVVLAGAPSIDPEYYELFLKGSHVRLVMNQTYSLLSQATAALVTSGTATLETCMFRVPQVVCYNLRPAKVFALLRRLLLKVKYVSLVNLIAGRELVTELVADQFNVEAIRQELEKILPGGAERQRMLDDYEEIHRRLGESEAPDTAAEIMINLLKNKTR